MTDETAQESFENYVEQHHEASAYRDVEEVEVESLAEAWKAEAQAQGFEQQQIDALGDLAALARGKMHAMNRAELARVQSKG